MSEKLESPKIEAHNPFGALAGDIEGLLGETVVAESAIGEAAPQMSEERVIEAQARSTIRALVCTYDDVVTEGSVAQREAIARSGLFEELHIIVFTTVRYPFHTLQIAPKAWVYPTNSSSWWYAPYDAFRTARREMFFAGTFRADVVAADDPFELGLTAWGIASWYSRPLHVTAAVNPEEDAYLDEDPNNSYRRIIARFVFSRAVQVRALTESIAAMVRSRAPHLQNAVDVIPRFIDVHAYADAKASFNLHQKYSQFQFIMVLAGMFDTTDSIAFALNASQHALRQYASVGLLIVGNGRGVESAQQLIAARGLAGKVFIEQCATENIPSFIQTADTLLAFSPDTSEEVLISAAATGVPILAVHGGIADSIIEDDVSGIIFAPSDLGSAIKGINRYMGDSGYRTRMSMQAKERIKGVGGDVLVYNERYRLSLERAILGTVVMEERPPEDAHIPAIEETQTIQPT